MFTYLYDFLNNHQYLSVPFSSSSRYMKASTICYLLLKMYFPFNNLFCVLCNHPEYDTDYAYLQFYFKHENGLLLTCIPSCLRGRISLRDSERVEGFSLLISRIQKHSPEWCLDTSVWPISWRMRMCIVKPTYSEQNLTPFPFRRMPRIPKWTYVMNFSFFKLKTR